MKSIGIVVLTLSLAFGLTARGGVAAVYVSTNAAPEQPYDTWATAFTNVQDALDWAADPGNDIATIHLAGHTFAAGGDGETVYRFDNATNVTLRGGYEGVSGGVGNEPGARNPNVWTTVVARADSGDNGRVLTVTDASNVIFEAIVFRDGYYYTDERLGLVHYGGGILISDSQDIVLDDCRIIDNYIRPHTDSSFGGGLALLNSSATLTNVLLAGNIAICTVGASWSGAHGGDGAGAYIDGDSRLTVIRSIIRENSGRGGGSGARGGAFSVAAGGTLDVFESVIVNNVAIIAGVGGQDRPMGGAIHNAGNLNLRNVLVAGNRTEHEGGAPTGATQNADGIHHAGGTFTMVNCTVVDNYWGDAGGPGEADHIGIYFGGGSVAVTNSIVWNHDVSIAGETAEVGYSNIEGEEVYAGDQNINADPSFVDAAEGDYRLQRGSPAIDAGLNQPWMAGATDLAGLPRVMMGTVDMGCYETIPPAGTLFLMR